MRLKAIVCALLMCATMASNAFAQAGPRTDFDPVIIPDGVTEIRYRKSEEIPRQLRNAIGPSCHYLSRLDDLSIRVVRPVRGGPLIALVPCDGMITRSIAFSMSRSTAPKAIEFVVGASPEGFGVTDDPGYLEWHSETQTLTATQFTDVTPGLELRHTYRHVGGIFPFVLIGIESRPKSFGSPDQPWTPNWEAPNWGKPK